VIAVVSLLLLLGASTATAAPVPNTALILGSTVSPGTATDNSGNSLEQQQAEADGYTVTVADDTTWSSMTAADFAKYQVIVIGDPSCDDTVDTDTVAYANRAVWEPVVMGSGGNKVLIGTDPTFHNGESTDLGTARGDLLEKNGIAYAGAVSGATGLYMDLSCTYDSTPAATPVPILDGLSTHGSGQFTAVGEGALDACATGVNVVAQSGPTAGLTDEDLSDWQCSVHEAFDKYPSDYTPLALAPTSSGFPSSYCATDVETDAQACGSPYVLVSGGGVTITSNISLTPPAQTLGAGSSKMATVTATVLLNGNPESGKSVTFNVDSGPNAGQTFTGSTDANGQVKFTYSDAGGAGTDSISATFVDDTNNTEKALGTVTWNSLNGDQPDTGNGQDVSGTEGQALNNAVVATFTDPDNDSTAGDYEASINWGDGHTTAGTITGSDGSYTVSGSNSYAEHGSYTVTVTITDGDNTANTTTTTSTATIADAPLAATALPFTATEGKQLNAVSIATFTDGDKSASASEYSAKIDWGDGTTTAGTVTGSTGSFNLAGSHTYAEHGSYTLKVTVQEVDNAATAVSATATATVADAPLSASGKGTVTTPSTAFSGAVATFTDANAGAPLSDFSAAVNWGDGHTTAGTITGAAGSYTVSASHAYAAAGSYSVTVTITDVDGSTASAQTTIVVPAPKNSPPACAKVIASPGLLWPPNHKFVLVRLSGATDPDHDSLSYSITGVTQDEPVIGLGQGDKQPDAKTSSRPGSVYVRAERSGNGHGRLYFIAFTVADGNGGTCSGSVAVAVPHDHHQRHVADTGKRFNSFKTTSTPSHKKHHKHHNS
jgi:hypothetical protein